MKMDNYFLIPACFVVPIAAAAVIMYMRVKMGDKAGDKKSKKGKQDKGHKGETEQSKASQVAPKKSKTGSDRKSSKQSSTEDAATSAGKSMHDQNTGETLPDQSEWSPLTNPNTDPPSQPTKPKRRNKGKNSVAGELEKSSKKESSTQNSSVPAGSGCQDAGKKLKETKLTTQLGATLSLKTVESINEKITSPIKSTEQEKPKEDSKKESKSTLPTSDVQIDNQSVKSEITKTKQKAPLPKPDIEKTSSNPEPSVNEKVEPVVCKVNSKIQKREHDPPEVKHDLKKAKYEEEKPHHIEKSKSHKNEKSEIKSIQQEPQYEREKGTLGKNKNTERSIEKDNSKNIIETHPLAKVEVKMSTKLVNMKPERPIPPKTESESENPLQIIKMKTEQAQPPKIKPEELSKFFSKDDQSVQQPKLKAEQPPTPPPKPTKTKVEPLNKTTPNQPPLPPPKPYKSTVDQPPSISTNIVDQPKTFDKSVMATELSQKITEIHTPSLEVSSSTKIVQRGNDCSNGLMEQQNSSPQSNAHQIVPTCNDQPNVTSNKNAPEKSYKFNEQSPDVNTQQENRKLSGFMEKSIQSDSNIQSNMEDDAKNISTESEKTQIRVLTLNSGDHLKESLYRLQKGFILQIRLGPSLFGNRTNIFTNCPKSISDTFCRKKYRKLQWQTDSLNRGDDTSLFVNIQIQTAGSFHFYLTLDDCTDLDLAKASGYFLVDPILTTGENNEVLPLDSIQCDTYMSKNLGTLDRWPAAIKVAKEAGYNMIHFTPIQELGSSRSGYSIQDQLNLNPEFSTAGKKYQISDVKEIVQMMDKKWKMLSITDIVLNHTANESKWLEEHPECTFNLENSPHLRPAYVLDRVIYHLALEIAEDKWASRGIPKELVHEHQVQALEHILHNEILHKHKVEEYFLLDIDSLLQQFRLRLKQKRRPSLKFISLVNESVEIIPDPQWRRFKSTVDMDAALQQFNIVGADCNDMDRIDQCCLNFRDHLDHLNRIKCAEIRNHISCAVGCIIGTVRYERLQLDGPKITKVNKKHPLVPRYFTHYGKDSSIEEEEKRSFEPSRAYIMAHNGWVVGDDPLRNFAAPGSNVYLKRELNAWGDSVKLRFGDDESDCPYLWNYMKRYVEKTAEIFHGIRLDNCHSTPIHVAEYLLDCARKVRPELYVIAELFTASDKTDNVFVNRLGISSLIREAMSAPNSHEEGRLVYRYGGEPVGAFILPPVRPLVPSIAHAMFLDVTHDNKSPCETRTAWDMLPSTALVNMASCASGSTRGYDEIVPHHIHVVTEERKYTTWTEHPKAERGTVNASSGIIGAKKILNDLHHDLSVNGFHQVYVDQVTEHIVTVTRHNPVTHESVVLVAYTSFRPPAHINNGHIRPLTVQGNIDEILFEIKTCSKNDSDRNNKVPDNFVKDEEYINGIEGFHVEIRKSLQPKDSTFVKQISAEGDDTSSFQYTGNFTPGSVIAFKLSLLPTSKSAITKLRSLLADFGYKKKISEVDIRNKELLDIVKTLSLSDLNRILYRCEQEESDEGRGWGSYNIPKFGSFVYCGLQGLMSEMVNIRVNNDLGHPICGNLRDGDWLMDYIVGRLKLEPSSEKLAKWLEDKFDLLKHIPKYLIPAYFDAVITALYLTLINYAWMSMSRFVSSGSGFAKALGLCSVQFCGVVKSALLPKLSPNLKSPRPPKSVNSNNEVVETSVSISAGLPHFSVGYMRNWGRDTFIALPGNLLITGRYDEARWIILAFAGTLRHGLIPNLLDGGLKARFNCRDSVWFWLYSIQRYVDLAPNGHEILRDVVSRIFPDDDSEPMQPGKCDQPLEDIIQEALQRHFSGLKFRERNAGYKIDSQMSDNGFNNEIGVNLDTGFPFGGNENNCGTWMDKMGSSAKSGNKGNPATPRDGSAVEIVGLCKSTVNFLARMHSEGKFSFNGVTREDHQGNEITWSYAFWDCKIKENFEKYFWVNTTPEPEYENRPELINRRGIYKDIVGATQPWTDFQLRCNFPIALAVAPDMISTKNGKVALANAEELLLGPIGIKTLDAKDWAYRGDYDNSNDSTDPTVAQGYNYHQGPEWVWPVGWFLRAKLAISSNSGSKEEVEQTLCEIKSILAPRFTHLLSTPWRSLPELTNSNGLNCPDSNPAQSWSTGCLLEVLWDMHKIGEKYNIQI